MIVQAQEILDTLIEMQKTNHKDFVKTLLNIEFTENRIAKAKADKMGKFEVEKMEKNLDAYKLMEQQLNKIEDIIIKRLDQFSVTKKKDLKKLAKKEFSS